MEQRKVRATRTCGHLCTGKHDLAQDVEDPACGICGQAPDLRKRTRPWVQEVTTEILREVVEELLLNLEQDGVGGTGFVDLAAV